MKILLPVDNSTYCQAATRVAFQLASAIPNATLEVLHIVNVRPPSGNVLHDLSGYVGFEPAVVSQDIYDAHQTAAQALVDATVARATTEGLKAEGSVVTGAVTAEIVKAANHSDLVVMGVRGESEDRHPNQGGAQASNAMPQIDVPVLLVPREVTRISSLAVGYDGSPAADRALRTVERFARHNSIPVHLIYVGDPTKGEPILEAGRKYLGEVKTIFHMVSGPEVHKALIETAVAAHADCLVLGFSGKSQLKDVVFGSAREHLLNNQLRVSVLVAH